MADTAPGAYIGDPRAANRRPALRPVQWAKQSDLEETNATLDAVHAELHEVIDSLKVFERALAAVIEDVEANLNPQVLVPGIPEDAEQPGEFETEDSAEDAVFEEAE